MRTKTVALLVLLAYPAIAAAQSTQSTQPTFRAGVELLEVDLVVVDDQGRPVGDLHAPEFTVTVDGERRHVVSADFVSFGGPVTPTGAVPKAPAPEPSYVSTNVGEQPGRLLVFVVDQGNIQSGEGRPMMLAAARFLDRLSPTDRVALYTIPPPGPTVDFTSNHDLVRTALAGVVGAADRFATVINQYNIGIYEALALDEQSDQFTVNKMMQRLCGDAATAAAEGRCELDVQVEAKRLAQEVRAQRDVSLRALRAVLERLRDIDGPKSLVLISQGLVLDRTAGIATDIGSIAAASRASINVLMLDTDPYDSSIMEHPPSAREDRNLQVLGLDTLAARSGGTLLRVFGNPDNIFERLNRELSGYYLLGVEATLGDKDGKRHQIRVDVGRRGVTLRSRREFQVGATTSASDGGQTLGRMLRSPSIATELPVRVATYAYQDANTSKVRVLAATEIDRTDSDSDDMMIGFALFDRQGKIVASGQQHKTLISTAGKPMQYDVEFVVDPGDYTIKLAVLDSAGRRGSVEREVTAWQMSGQPVAVGDLMLADAPNSPTATIHPTVNLRVGSGRLAAYMEVYAERAETLQDAKIVVEVASDESSPALTTGTATLRSRGTLPRLDASALVPVEMLPPGRYIARATVTAGGNTVGTLTRPFELLAMKAAPAPPATALAAAEAAEAAGAAEAAKAAESASAVPAVASLVAPSVPAFQRDEVLKPEVLQSVYEAIDQARPAAKAAVARARLGRLEGTGIQALEAGDQVAAAFLRGLELFSKGQLTPAATQFGVALNLAPNFGPAAFYLGACYALIGRDQEAGDNWEKTIAAQWQVPLTSRVLGQARLRLGQTARAIEPLRAALTGSPDDDGIRRNLAIAYLTTAQQKDAYVTIEPYLLRHPTDHEAFLLAIQALYQMHSNGQSIGTPEEDRQQTQRYAQSYAAARGPLQPLVAKWADFISQNSH